ncbi:hypothetical protein PF011_g12583 [Phytophthora fragariae]|uniref:Uncharacterized protein n=1 Tax=Phytophthora fragariae TaxID=53985 RepID=A0A6A3KKB1_9STRA|nr:hypothetical protein PF011_g12583 [Phytophthora fragariae]
MLTISVTAGEKACVFELVDVATALKAHSRIFYLLPRSPPCRPPPRGPARHAVRLRPRPRHGLNRRGRRHAERGDSEGGDSDTPAEPSDEEGDGSSSEEASTKVKTKFWCAYKGCRNPPTVKQSFRRYLEMRLTKDNKACTLKRLNKYNYSMHDGRIFKSPAMTRQALMLMMHVYEDGLRQLMKAQRAMAKEQLVMKNQTKMKKTQEDILSHVEKDGVVPMVFSLMKCVEELSQKVDGLSSQLVTNIIDQASKIKQTIKQKKREAKLPSTSPKRAHDQDPSKVSTRARGVVSQQRGRCRDQATSAASREDDSDQGSKDNSDQGSSDGSAQGSSDKDSDHGRHASLDGRSEGGSNQGRHARSPEVASTASSSGSPEVANAEVASAASSPEVASREVDSAASSPEATSAASRLKVDRYEDHHAVGSGTSSDVSLEADNADSCGGGHHAG